jgi:anti-sigma regulatory factor (Ser/Thr protein kinase)
LRELALHLLDIIENSISAGASRVIVTIEEDLLADTLSMCIEDNGKGMDAEMVSRVIDPFVTSRTTRKVGLGIPLLKAAAEDCNGSLTIDSTPGAGTKVSVKFQHSHIDRMPLGDLPGTFLGLVVGSPDVQWIIRYTFNQATFEFDNQPILEELEGIPLTEPAVLQYLRTTLEDGFSSIKQSSEYPISSR